ncbi:hypothetical protein H072_2735 [Dactylellina haptotyla CBS 200.50]|uniref:Uncharacterized protein n=1 Tax=Dactylellina haptotyla (strain CBS 200.50) TaxID=1284197 RepID=S8BUS8_DACHA|nr:hypothetical protein H072_2735 [Dactylellina haptotyla CBS 200.50]
MPPARTARSVADGARFVQNVKNRADATRFAQNVRSPPVNGNGETPQQRVARLREAARRERMNQVTTFDKVVHHGRRWADNLHRATVFTIMGFSAVTVGVTVFSVYGMITQSRSNRREYMTELQKEQKAQWETWRQSEIRELVKTGLESDEAAKLFDEAEEKRRYSKTFFGRVKTWAYGGLTPAEETYMSRFELHDGRIQKQVFSKLQKEFYDKRGMELPKKEEDDDDEEVLERSTGVTAMAAAVDGIVPTVSAADVKDVKDATKSDAKGYWGTLRSLVTGGRM